ncbi:MAG: hypothetical protein JWM68_624 [Verrucomicrobiales bacterium]|nr:hypothetical protein [Verrucomicrobiales bacterium]
MRNFANTIMTIIIRMCLVLGLLVGAGCITHHGSSIEQGIVGRWKVLGTGDVVVLSKDRSATLSSGGRTISGSYTMGASDLLLLTLPATTPGAEPRIIPYYLNKSAKTLRRVDDFNSYGADSSQQESERVTKTLKIKIPNKVDFVHWSIQGDSCTVQITLPAVPLEQKQPEHAQIQVWLLKSDGTVIPQNRKPSTPWISTMGFKIDHLRYSFPPSAQTEAVAVVVSIDEELFVERLPLNPT